MLNDWGSLEDTATDVSGIHLSVKPECVCVCSCVFPPVSKQRDSPVNISFQYAASPPLLHPNSDHRNMQGCTPSQTNTNKHRGHTHTHTHTCSVSRRSCRLRGSRLQRFRAGATTVQTHLPSGSEAVLYTCQPSSEPGYKPCTQTGSALMMSLQEQQLSCAFNSGEGQQSEAKSKFYNSIVCFVFCQYSGSHFWGYLSCFNWIYNTLELHCTLLQYCIQNHFPKPPKKTTKFSHYLVTLILIENHLKFRSYTKHFWHGVE